MDKKKQFTMNIKQKEPDVAIILHARINYLPQNRPLACIVAN
ncbi:MAG: hypothetical protein YK1309IOTA_390009 [Marine Group I thaumarchaeote]|nr:MAG: hypothetical protein YK1309IOTA_390009 [Marine Group I thaumarchaeote]